MDDPGSGEVENAKRMAHSADEGNEEVKFEAQDLKIWQLLKPLYRERRRHALCALQ